MSRDSLQRNGLQRPRRIIVIRRTGMFILLLLCGSALGKAQGPWFPFILSVTENAQGTAITISGSGFGEKTPKVTLGTAELTVTSSSNTSVTAKVPAGAAAGIYLLTVENVDQHWGWVNKAIFEATLGEIGPAGPAGPAGTQGPMGLPGPMGLQGPQGQPGATGVAGPAGAMGAQGLIGPAGPTGPIGLQGPVGLTGATGAAGAQGPAGPAGAAGPAGPIGPQGPIGQAGATGAAGAQGPAGAAGAMGVQGPAGPTGPEGPTGPAGPAGTAGPGVWTSNFVVPASLANLGGGTIFAVPIGTSTAVFNYQADTPASVVQVPQSCTVGNLSVVAFNVQGTSTATVGLGTATSASNLASNDLFGLDLCTLKGNNGAPISCTSTGTPAVTAGQFVNDFIDAFSNAPDYQNARIFISFTCR